MKFITILAVTFFAGMGAGLGTGFAGMSAAAVISPMLITFLGMDPYMAVGITGRTMNLTPSRKVMNTEKPPMVWEGRRLAI